MDMGMTVLVVDDFATMRRIIKGVLKDLGFKNVIEAENGKVALSELKKEEIGLVIADWNMPEMTGIDLLKALRSDDRFKELPFIMVTAEGQKANVIEAVKAGVTNYIVKPFTPDTLKQKLEAIFG
ncbi:MAG: chemotaxis response regulator CheY [Deltaproteobacteria bacterium]|nr:chemotaxis response regulator CheY [Deltaproteobacteria bacterium]MBW1928371.1 chemotaxis response regulator CheY [Deltaproteobacteria bacterium]MBW2023830.1 chemotaxis response regulator CheY [Deltaproteobacteria bacterium]MBW2124557.1 chemotaxis response regulator CheY [Deltaproteobacteria bacterium]RLB15539.1 MAG: response regulator [Deltaproteobacteria bacterium]